MDDAVYEKLVHTLNSYGTILPSIACPEYFAFVSYLFTPEEAAILNAMPKGFSRVEAIAGQLQGVDTSRLAEKLETMCDKGLIHSKPEKGKTVYGGLPFVPGICELQFLKGVVDERHKKIASLLDDYNRALKEMFKASAPAGAKPSFPGRTLVVNQDVYEMTTIIPYHEAKELISNSFVAAGICNCRHQGVLRDRSCGNPLDNCMVLGTSAEFTSRRGFTWQLTRDEALKMLDDAEKAGLIHQYCNTPGSYTNLLCHCCDCHCLLMRGVKRAPVPNQACFARYIIKINDEDCIGCEACVQRCQMKALKLVDYRIVRDDQRCIGCGICMYACPTEALSLEPTPLGKIPLKPL
jgi:electron transport complex protein RnfB